MRDPYKDFESMQEKLLLIPGFASNALYFQHQIAHLADVVDPQVITLTQEEDRNAMVGRILNEAPKRFILAGHSMGGWVASAVAAAAPERIIKLCLLNTWCRPHPELNGLQRQILAAIEQGDDEKVMLGHLPSLFQDPSKVAFAQKIVESFAPEVLVRQLRAMLKDFSSENLGQITAPTLIVQARNDVLFPIEEGEALLKAIPHAKLAVIEDCGHASPLDKPEAVTALIRFFLEY
ncbi:MAG: alpha/beta hydrolase [Verrucomicrobia bacterium]|nr:alpha/beta hydrolase [Verrucomicrobiota bacterium]